jgi:hypothetical protein
MASSLLDHNLDPTPPRPSEMDDPAWVLVADIDVEVAHLANPVIAVSRLLASEGRAFARVTGDDTTLRIEIALPDTEAATTARATQWVEWAAHCAGIRGRTTVRTVPARRPRSGQEPTGGPA